ncbi:hypothetical protein [Candidatus Entotheonella palauensis]|uniref:Uncharacterized protein n=1 Tax=Candidatus Entotheonella gemina TaxID=1429439 RepID=W4M5L8_9BACT|nr:hypothetical protein [Candidatus Entotheonella palauensis]ETX05231.1 MAG: hypothetical protein ETSY2_24185 [Candidatus Entotheonella gemina]
MLKRNRIKSEETATQIPALSTDAIVAPPEEPATSLPIRTGIRAGVSMDWQSLFGSLEENSDSL